MAMPELSNERRWWMIPGRGIGRFLAQKTGAFSGGGLPGEGPYVPQDATISGAISRGVPKAMSQGWQALMPNYRGSMATLPGRALGRGVGYMTGNYPGGAGPEGGTGYEQTPPVGPTTPEYKSPIPQPPVPANAKAGAQGAGIGALANQGRPKSTTDVMREHAIRWGIRRGDYTPEESARAETGAYLHAPQLTMQERSRRQREIEFRPIQAEREGRARAHELAMQQEMVKGQMAANQMPLQREQIKAMTNLAITEMEQAGGDRRSKEAIFGRFVQGLAPAMGQGMMKPDEFLANIDQVRGKLFGAEQGQQPAATGGPSLQDQTSMVQFDADKSGTLEAPELQEARRWSAGLLGEFAKLTPEEQGKVKLDPDKLRKLTRAQAYDSEFKKREKQNAQRLFATAGRIAPGT